MAYTTIDDSSAFFQCTLYTGNGSNRSITNTGHSDLQPDLTWLKARSESEYNFLYDVVRGATKGLSSDLTAAEATYNDGLTAFGSDGFSLGTSNGINRNGTTYVSWNWKAGTSVSGNTGGSGTAKTYTGSVNTDAGFSIIRYIGNGSAGHTIPHHLGTTPAWVIARTISAEKEWDVYHHKNTSSPETDYLVLNTTAATSDSNDKWNDTAPTSSVVTLGDSSQLNTNDGTCIMYAFAEKQGFSKFGSYTGNGNANGTFIYTGFKPAMVIFKQTSGGNHWYMFDNKRNPFNPKNIMLKADTNGAESTDLQVDFLSNGINYVTSDHNNSNGQTYVYMAFAENPFVTSTGIPATAR
jgi:hypothetical protein